MTYRRRAIALTVSATLVLSAAVSAQKNNEQRKLDDAQKKEIQAIVKMVDDPAGAQSMGNDLGLAWVQADFLKAQGDKQYVPFTVSIDPSKVPGGTVALYWRVMAKGGEPPPAAGQKKDDKNKKPAAA